MEKINFQKNAMEFVYIIYKARNVKFLQKKELGPETISIGFRMLFTYEKHYKHFYF